MPATLPKIHIIIGSTREGRFGDKLAQYLFNELAKRHDVQAELVDLRDWPLPFFDAPVAPAGMAGKYSNERAKEWATKVGEGDGYIMVTPEYNHGYPAVLKNALDWVFPEWNLKPVGFAGYGNAGGARAIEQLRQVVIELQMVPIRNAIHIPVELYLAIVGEKTPVNPDLFKPLREGLRGDRVTAFFDELLTLTNALKEVRK